MIPGAAKPPILFSGTHNTWLEREMNESNSNHETMYSIPYGENL